MAYQLKLDEIIEALGRAGHPLAGDLRRAVAAQAQLAGAALAAHLGIECGVADCQESAFAGLCMPFFPKFRDQTLPESMEGFDTESEWTDAMEHALPRAVAAPVRAPKPAKVVFRAGPTPDGKVLERGGKRGAFAYVVAGAYDAAKMTASAGPALRERARQEYDIKTRRGSADVQGVSLNKFVRAALKPYQEQWKAMELAGYKPLMWTGDLARAERFIASPLYRKGGFYRGLMILPVHTVEG